MDKMFDAIFLDRDGTISHDPHGYINSLSEYNFFDYAFEALEVLSKYTDKFVIVTNQSGLASGKIDIENLEEINSFIYKEFKKIISFPRIHPIPLQRVLCILLLKYAV